jgi:hypothetical protein
MIGASTQLGSSPHWFYKVGLVFSIVYCFVAGVLGLWTPVENGIDLSVCYVAGVTSVRGSSPYNHAELTDVRQTLSSLAGKPSYPFAYPPSVIPACVLLSLLPWQGAQGLWKLLNMAFLTASVLLTFRLFRGMKFGIQDAYLIWSFAFIFSPTVSVLLVGQSSLFVLCTALLAIVTYKQGKPWSSGFSVALALTKPHLMVPLVLFFLSRRQFKIPLIALTAVGALGMLGLHIGHSGINSYLQGLQRYAYMNSPTNPRLVGLQSLLGGVLGLSSTVTSVLSLMSGLALVGITLLWKRTDNVGDHTTNVLPVLLVISVLAFGAHSYDLVFLLPVMMWAVGRKVYPIVILCLVLVVPLSAVTLVYEKLLSNAVPLSIFQVVIEPFRSWILAGIFFLLLYLTGEGTAQQRQAELA